MAQLNKSIYSALMANLLIAATKFIAGGFTNSSSMVSEGMHSLVDTSNELLLLYGQKVSRKPPDEKRPLGYGKELYFWSFIVSILIFGFGGGFSIYQGIQHIITPQPFGNPTWNYVVLGLSFIFEGISFIISLNAFNKTCGDDSFWEAVVRSKDPSNFIVLFEDGADVLGLIIVFILMLFGHAFNVPYLDGVASVLVGLLLVSVSLIVARESRSLLMGEGISATAKQQLIAGVEQDQGVVKVIELFSSYQGPEDVLLIITIAFNTNMTTADINNAITRLKQKIRTESKLIKFIVVQPAAVPGSS